MNNYTLLRHIKTQTKHDAHNVHSVISIQELDIMFDGREYLIDRTIEVLNYW